MAKHVRDELAQPEKKKKKFHELSESMFLSTGVTTMNLAFTGRKNCGYRRGRYVNFPGSSDSGKTMLCFTAFAEAAKNPVFDDYLFVYDPAEGATPPPLKEIFGQKVKDRLLILEDASETVEDFHEHFKTFTEKGTKPVIYLLDSSDALSAVAADKADTEGKGSMGTQIAKAWAKGFRKTDRYLKQSKSILIIISQTRQNIGYTAMFNPDTRSGGNALKFFARIEMWLKTIKEVKASDRKDRIIGQVAKAKITKNHFSGWKGFVTFYIDPKYGIDDLRGCVQFLVDEKVWPIRKKVIDAKQFNLEGKIDDLIQQIEFADLEEATRDLVVEKWNSIEASLKITRKKRYD